MEKIKYYIRTNKNEIFKTDEGLFNYVIELEQLVEKQKEVINKASKCIKNFLCSEEYIGVEGISIANNYENILDTLNEVSE